MSCSAYLAARYDRKDELRKYADQLTEAGVTSTSSWLNSHEEEMDGGELRQSYAKRDLEDVARANILVLFTEWPPTYTKGGRLIEAGYAMALGKTVAIIGPRENIFLEMNEVRQFQTWKECLEWLKRQAEDQDAPSLPILFKDINKTASALVFYALLATTVVAAIVSIVAR